MPDPERSLREGAIQPWAGGQTLEYFLRLLEALGEREGFNLDTPWRKLPQRAQKEILYGSQDQVHVRYRNKYGRERSYYTGFEGVVQWIERRHTDTDSEWSRDKYEGYMRDVPCPACGGARLKPEILAVTIAGRNIAEVCALSVGECYDFVDAARAQRPAADDRRAGAEGDQRPAAVPGRRRPGLPVAGPPGRHALRRRGAADPARHADRVRPGRRALRAGRAEHRPAPAGQPPTHRDVGTPEEPGQHADRGRARRGHHPDRRLDRRHRTRRRRARRPHRPQWIAQGPAQEPAVDHRGVPGRPPDDPAAR